MSYRGIYLWLIAILNCYCNNVDALHKYSNKTNSNCVRGGTSSTGNTVKHELIKMNFFDSVFAKLEITPEQIRKHTIIDDFYITNRSQFIGDTIQFVNSLHPLLIIRYDDRLVCMKKFMLVYDSTGLINTDCKIVETDCDDDESTDYSSLSFEVINDSVFETKEIVYDRQSNVNRVDTAVEINFWRISKDGKIDSLK